jgi:hypothetical protein
MDRKKDRKPRSPFLALLLTILMAASPVHATDQQDSEFTQDEQSTSRPDQVEEKIETFLGRRGRILIDGLDIRQWYTTLQTQISRDISGTIYVMTVFGNGDKQYLRIGPQKGVRKLIVLEGWPYILMNNGRLYALDMGWSTWFLKTKLPALRSRLITKIKPALACAGAFCLLSGLAVLSRSNGFNESEVTTPLWSGFTGISLFYLADAAMTIFIRSHRRLEQGGNFFQKEVARNIENIFAVRQDYVIKFKGKNRPDRNLSTMVPDYARRSSCIYSLTKLNME